MPRPPGPARTRTASSTCRSARPSTRPPRSCGGRWPAPPTRPGYPLTVGLAGPAPGRARTGWPAGAACTGLGLDAVLPTIGSKELIAVARRRTSASVPVTSSCTRAGLPDLRGRRPARRRAPVATRLADRPGPAAVSRCSGSTPRRTPPGGCCPVDHLRKVVDWCRERGALLVSDECYLECAWDAPPPVSVLHPDVCGGDHTRHPRGPLAVEAVQPRRLPLRLRRRRPRRRRPSCSRSARTSG